MAQTKGITLDGKYLFHDCRTIHPAVDVGAPGEYDCYDALDPTVVEFGGITIRPLAAQPMRPS